MAIIPTRPVTREWLAGAITTTVIIFDTINRVNVSRECRATIPIRFFRVTLTISTVSTVSAAGVAMSAVGAVHASPAMGGRSPLRIQLMAAVVFLRAIHSFPRRLVQTVKCMSIRTWSLRRRHQAATAYSSRLRQPRHNSFYLSRQCHHQTRSQTRPKAMTPPTFRRPSHQQMAHRPILIRHFRSMRTVPRKMHQRPCHQWTQLAGRFPQCHRFPGMFRILGSEVWCSALNQFQRLIRDSGRQDLPPDEAPIRPVVV